MNKKKAFDLSKFVPTQAQVSSAPAPILPCDNCGEKYETLTRWVEKNPKIVALTTYINICDKCAESISHGKS